MTTTEPRTRVTLDVDLCSERVCTTSIHQHLVDDPQQLVVKLRECMESGHTFGSWKAAQQICQNAGLPY